LEYFQNNYNNKIKWFHIGDGPLLSEIVKTIKETKNLDIVIMGYLSNEKINEFYQTNSIDCFITTTESEGGVPVSIQEAQSYGIPAIATNVGGVPEIVNNKTGIILNENPAPKDIAEAIYSLIKNPKRLEEIKLECRSNWLKNFNADKNFSSFVNDIRVL
jgi:glycosyltransferase involved in cell wall biosynthesis